MPVFRHSLIAISSTIGTAKITTANLILNPGESLEGIALAQILGAK
jgi:hypothetical protein